MASLKKILLLSAALMLVTIFTGCGMISKEKMDPPSVEYSNSIQEEQSTVTEEEGSTVMTELYLMDKHGYIVPASLPLPDTESVAKQALEYLVQEGPVTDLLPNGFQAVLPAETVVKSMDLSDGLATVDFSSELANYQAENEEAILQSIVWTLTQFDSVKNVAIRIDGEPLTEMPVAHLSLDRVLNREMGINNENSQVADIMNSHPVTVYFVGSHENSSYYVPVTRRVPNSSMDDAAVVVSELVKGPSPGTYLTSSLASDIALLNSSIADGVVTLNFNENVYSSSDGESKLVSEDMMQALVLSLTEQQGINKVSIEVNGDKDLVDVNGEPLAEPVSRPARVNAY